MKIFFPFLICSSLTFIAELVNLAFQRAVSQGYIKAIEEIIIHRGYELIITKETIVRLSTLSFELWCKLNKYRVKIERQANSNMAMIIHYFRNTENIVGFYNTYQFNLLLIEL